MEKETCPFICMCFVCKEKGHSWLSIASNIMDFGSCGNLVNLPGSVAAAT